MDKYDKAEYDNRPAAAKIFRKLCGYHPNFNG